MCGTRKSVKINLEEDFQYAKKAKHMTILYNIIITCCHRHDVDDGVPQNPLHVYYEIMHFAAINGLFSFAIAKIDHFHNPSPTQY